MGAGDRTLAFVLTLALAFTLALALPLPLSLALVLALALALATQMPFESVPYSITGDSRHEYRGEVVSNFMGDYIVGILLYTG